MLFIAQSLMDILGLGIIGPFVGLLIFPESSFSQNYTQFVQSVLGSIHFDQIRLFTGIGLIIVFISRILTSLFINWTVISFSSNQGFALRVKLIHNFIFEPYECRITKNVSEYMRSLLDYVNIFLGVALQPFLRLVADAMTILFIISFLFYTTGTQILVFFLLIAAVVFAYDRFARHHQVVAGREGSQSVKEMLKGISELLDGSKEVRVLNKESEFYYFLKNASWKNAYNWKKAVFLNTAPKYILEGLILISLVGFVLVLFYGSEDPVVSVSKISIITVGLARLLPVMSSLVANFGLVRTSTFAIDELHKELQILDKITTGQDNVSDETSWQGNAVHKIELENISYTYPNTSKPALDGISLQVIQGQSIGIIGATGAGKTTLVDVMLGLLPVQHGHFRVNGQEINPKSLQTLFAYVPQNNFLMDDTLTNNIALTPVATDVHMEDIIAAARKANILDFIQSLDNGFDTVIGERGMRLSGGQKQRIALARAFYHNRSFIIFDEATSALDDETEKEIIRELKRIKEQTTLIIIAHRLSTVEHCDYIYRLENGRIVEEGSFHTVVKNKQTIEA